MSRVHGRPAPRLPTALMGCAMLGLAAVSSGCTTTASQEPTEAPTPTRTSTATTTVGTLTSATVVTVVTTALTTAPPTTVTGDPTELSAPATGAPPATKEPEPVVGECPYLSTADLELINGQRAGATTVIAVEPEPICDFYRSDGDWQARIRIIEAATPEQATAAVDQHVPVADSAPASRPAGWSGGSMVTPDGIPGNPRVHAVYAVSKGNIAVVAESNQEQTIKARQMVIETVENLGL